MVTVNAGDFLALAAGIDLHPGLIILRENGLTREEQWTRLKPVVDLLKDNGTSFVNRVAEVFGPGEFELRELPK